MRTQAVLDREFTRAIDSTVCAAAHGHLAFYGAYVCLVLAIITYAAPILRNRDPYNQVLNMASFWLMSGGMLFMTFTLTFAGTLQTHLQRVNGEFYMDVQDQLGIFYWMRFGSGVAVVLGAILFIYALSFPRREVVRPGPLERERLANNPDYIAAE